MNIKELCLKKLVFVISILKLWLINDFILYFGINLKALKIVSMKEKTEMKLSYGSHI